MKLRKWWGGMASAAAVSVALLVPQAASAQTAPYVALGDSLTAGGNASSVGTTDYVSILFADYQTSLGADIKRNRAVPGSTSTSLRGTQLTNALADINDPATDTKAVTFFIGFNDGCSGTWDSSCPFRANFATTLADLAAALASDPGEEVFIVGAYPNPHNGTASEGATDVRLLGANLAVGCSDTGANVGLNDVIYQEAFKLGVAVADASAAFKQAGQSFISSDGLHPNDAGHAAIAQSFRDATVQCPASPPEGNPTPEPGPKADGTLTIDANKGKVEKGRKVLLSGQLDVASNESCEQNRQIQVQRRLKSEDDSKFATFQTVQTDATGNYSLKVKVKKTYFYRAVVAETDACDDETSSSQKVRVQKKKAAQEA